MAAVIIGALFGLGIAAAGLPVAGWLSRSRPPTALGAGLALSAMVVAGTDVAAAWSFQPWTLIGAWILMTASGIVMAVVEWRGTWLRIGHLSRLPLTGILALTALAAAFPLLLFPVPLDTDAQGFGMLALAIREGRTIDTLAPWRPEIAYLYSPGALLIFAAVSSVFDGFMLPTIMMGVSHACLVLFVWVAWELGGELALAGESDRDAESSSSDRGAWSWAAAVSAALSVGLWSALLDSHYTAVIGLLLALACLTAFFRYQRTGRARDLFATTVALAAVAAAHQDTAIALALGFAAFLLVGWVAAARPLRLMTGVLTPPIGALILLSPWVYRLWPSIGSGMRSPFEVSPTHLRQLLLYHGLLWPLLAFVGAIVSIRQRRWWTLAAIGWLLLVVEFSAVGLLEQLAPAIAEPLVRFSYPFSLAWHGPIIPYLVLGAAAIAWLMERAHLAAPTLKPGLLVLAAGVMVLGVSFSDRLLLASRSALAAHGAFASANDLRAMRWIRDRTASDARILNYPGDYEALRDWEAHWAPVVTERDCIYFRRQPFYLERAAATDAGNRGLETAYAEQRALLAFWRDPLDPAQPGLLGRAGIDYVLVPESIGDPHSMTDAWRWQPPARLTGGRSVPRDAPYLRLVYSMGGAQVYEVVRNEDEAAASTETANRRIGDAPPR
jgi:hypothetical protein